MAIRFKNVDSYIGALRVAFDDVTGTIVGVHTNAPSRTGVIDGDLANISAALIGQHILVADRTGVLAAVLGNVTAALRSPIAARTLFASADFSSGEIVAQPTQRSQTFNRLNNGISIKCTAKVQNPSTSKTKWANAGGHGSPGLFSAAEQGGAEAYDVHVCDGETIVQGGVSDTITPREGPYFLRSYQYAALDRYNSPTPNYTDGFRHYEGPNVNSTGDNAAHIGPPPDTVDCKCKPRSEMGFSNRDAYGIAYDTRAFFGFALRLHKDHEPVNKANGNKQASNGSGPQLGEMNPDTTGVAGSIMVFSLNIPENTWINCTDAAKRTIGASVGTQTKHWWCLKVSLSTTSDQENAGAGEYALAPVDSFGSGGDAGRWTDFIFELCINPFTVATVDNGWNFRANTGLLRVWKSTGPYLAGGNGMNRSMEKSLSYINGTRGGLLLERIGQVGLRPPLDHGGGRDPQDMAPWNIGGKHYCYMYRSDMPGGIDCKHGSYMGIAARRFGFAENRQHSAANGAANSNIVTQFQGGVATTWEDVQPMG